MGLVPIYQANDPHPGEANIVYPSAGDPDLLGFSQSLFWGAAPRSGCCVGGGCRNQRHQPDNWRNP